VHQIATMEHINLFVLGKTGTGKSSLINYLSGRYVAISAVGKPQTGTGFHEKPPFIHENSIEIVLYDSWGLEADKATDWQKLLQKEIKSSDSRDLDDCIHNIVYCIDSSVARVEDFEINEVIRPLISSGYNCIFALTKAFGPTQIDDVGKLLREEFPQSPCIPVNSQECTLRNGKTVKQFGKEEILQHSCATLLNTLAPRILDAFERRCLVAFADMCIKERECILEVSRLHEDSPEDLYPYMQSCLYQMYEAAWQDLMAKLADEYTLACRLAGLRQYFKVPEKYLMMIKDAIKSVPTAVCAEVFLKCLNMVKKDLEAFEELRKREYVRQLYQH
jgi:GTPase SAR1 family protein